MPLSKKQISGNCRMPPNAGKRAEETWLPTDSKTSVLRAKLKFSYLDISPFFYILDISPLTPDIHIGALAPVHNWPGDAATNAPAPQRMSGSSSPLGISCGF